MPNIEQVINEISSEIARVQNESLWISNIDLEYGYSQQKLSEETSR